MIIILLWNTHIEAYSKTFDEEKNKTFHTHKGHTLIHFKVRIFRTI